MVKRRLAFCIGMLLGIAGGTATFGAWTVTDPGNGADFSASSPIPCQGAGIENETKVLKLIHPTSDTTGTVMSSKNLQVGEGMTWDHNFEPPNTGWPETGETIIGIYNSGVTNPYDPTGGFTAYPVGPAIRIFTINGGGGGT